MPNLSMNTGMPEQDRSLEDPCFNNIKPETNTRMPTVPYAKPKPISFEGTGSSNTAKIDIGKSAHDITVGGRNGG